MRINDWDLPMQNRPANRKKAVNVSIDPVLAAEAKEFGTNMSAVLEEALHSAHRKRRQAKWTGENRPAIDAWNKLVEDGGLWAEKYRG